MSIEGDSMTACDVLAMVDAALVKGDRVARGMLGDALKEAGFPAAAKQVEKPLVFVLEEEVHGDDPFAGIWIYRSEERAWEIAADMARERLCSCMEAMIEVPAAASSLRKALAIHDTRVEKGDFREAITVAENALYARGFQHGVCYSVWPEPVMD